MKPYSKTESKWQREYDDYKNRGNKSLLKRIVQKIRRRNSKKAMDDVLKEDK